MEVAVPCILYLQPSCNHSAIANISPRVRCRYVFCWSKQREVARLNAVWIATVFAYPCSDCVTMLWSMVCSILAFFTSITEAFPAAAPVRPAKGVVSVSSLEVETEGSGCRPGEVSVTLSSDNSVITLILDNFAAADGPQAGTTGSRAFCRINVGMNMPGWAFDISSADFRGYVSLDKGVNASLVSRWKWIDKSGVDLKGKVEFALF